MEIISYNKSITLCGIKHSGKSSVGKVLSQITSLPLIDTDELITKSYNNKSIREIYKELREEEFRNLEMSSFRNNISNQISIISLGGGFLSNPNIRPYDISKLGVICYLNIDDKIAFNRILNNGLPPFLADLDNPFEKFCEINSSRKKVFKKYSRIIIDITNEKPSDIALKILDKYQRMKD